jgi:hypothetical protein
VPCGSEDLDEGVADGDLRPAALKTNKANVPVSRNNMKQLLLVGFFSVGCFAQAIEGDWCESRCNSQVAAKFESPSPSDQVAAPIVEPRHDGQPTDDRSMAPLLRSAMVQVAAPVVETRHDGRRMENHWTAPVLRSTMVPIVVVRSIADDGDDLAEALLPLWRDFPGLAWCLQYLADIFTAVVLPILAMFAVYLAAVRLASSLPRTTSVSRQREDGVYLW